jgi:photosystem II stability/assembly factor-like uncharacterized protein
VWRGDNLARYVWIDPRDSRVIYVSTGIFDREAANSDPGQGKPGGEGVLKSIDGGATWMRVNNGLGNLYVGSLFMHPTNPDILLAGTGNNQYQSETGVYLSLDGGNNWSNTLPSDSAITSVEIAQSNTNIAYAGSRSAVYRSEDGGRTWHQVAGGSIPWGSPGVQTGFPIDFQVDPRNPDRLFANAYGGGAFLSEDGGRTWKVESKGYTGAQVRSIAVDPTAPGRLVTAARSGVFASANGGSDWAGVNPANFDSIEWNAVAIDPADPQHFIAGLNVHGWLANSLDGGSTWQTVEGPHENRIGWRAIAFAPSNPGVVYAGSAGYYSAGTFDPSQPGIGIYVSHNHGNSWTPANDSQTLNAHVTSLAVDPSEPQVVFAATANHGLVKTEDSGKNWVTLKGGWSVKTMILSVAVSPVNPKVVVAGTNQAGLWLSTDGGQTWKYTGYGLNPEASIADIVFDPADPSKQLYLADHFGGVYRSTDGGKSWRTLNNGLLNRDINSLAFSSDGLHLYAASEGAGVFRLDLNGAPPPALAQIPTQARNPTTESIQVTPYVYQEATTTSTPGKKPLFNLPCGSTAVLSLALIVSLYAGRRRRMH